MNDLFIAIYAKYLASSLAALMTGLYNTKAPADIAYPYGVFSLPDDKQDFTFTEAFERCLVHFNLFSDQSSSQEVGTLFEALKTCFDFLDLTINNYTPVSMVRQGSSLEKVEEETKWKYGVDYMIVLQKI